MIKWLFSYQYHNAMSSGIARFPLVGKKNNDEQPADQTPKGVAVCVLGAKGDNDGLGQTHHISATHKITQIQKHI